MFHFLIALGLFSNFLMNSAYPEGIVRGKVFDNKTGEVLAGVFITYGNNLGTITNQDGLYQIKTANGKLEVTFQFIGYKSVTKEISVKEGETAELDVGLEMKIREIDQIVVSANKTEQRIAELSVSMDIIKTSFLTDNHISDAEELINKTPGIEVMDGQASIRGGSGFSYGAGSRVLALIDGLPMVSADAGNIKWQFLPLENLSQVEIIKGASSVLYGSSALNGVINFRTADATNIPVTNFFTEVGVYGNPGNQNWIWWTTPREYTSTSISHLQKFGKTDVGFSANLLVDQGYRRLNEETLGRISLKLKHFNTKVEGLTYGMGLNYGTTVKHDFLLWEDADSGALKQSVSTATEYHGVFFAADPFITFKKSDRYKHDLHMRVQSSLNRLPETPQNNSDAISVYSEYQLRYRLAGFLDLTGGVSENYNHVKSKFFGDHNGTNIAGFMQAEIRPLPRLKAVAGIRVEGNSLDGITDKIVPIFRAGLNWQAADYTFLRASFGQGYRYPSIAEKFAATTLGTIKIIANPNILSESGWSSELGVKQGLLFGNISGQADFSLFYMQNSNLIEYVFGAYPVEGLGFKATNREESRVYGSEIEFYLSGSFGKFNMTINGGYTFIYPVEYDTYSHKNKDIYLKYRRKHSGKITLNTTWKKFETELGFYFKSRILNIDDVFLNTQILPGFDKYWPEHNNGYSVIDAILGYRFNEKFKLSLAVKNLTNTEYMGRPGDIQPQRNFSLRFSMNF
jgi:iron complex outermembrane receptor protein